MAWMPHLWTGVRKACVGSASPVRRAAHLAAAGFLAGAGAAFLIGRSLMDGGLLEVLGGAGICLGLGILAGRC
jgi:hypothetical protein